MSTIIRVKRRCDEEPQDIIIVNCKKRKTSEETLDSSDKTPTVLQLAGTVKNQEDDVLKHCKTSLKENIETDIKKKTHQNVFQSIRDRVREECIQNSKENRYKVVNLCRSNSHNDDGVTIVDVEADKMVEDVESKPQYVYDLYYTISDDLGEIYDHDLVGVYPLSNELVYGSHRDNGAADSDDDESEDSNAENNWRNEYPDEDEYRDDNSITEDDMISAMQHVHLDKDDLSSDDEMRVLFIVLIVKRLDSRKTSMNLMLIVTVSDTHFSKHVIRKVKEIAVWMMKISTMSMMMMLMVMKKKLILHIIDVFLRCLSMVSVKTFKIVICFQYLSNVPSKMQILFILK